MAFQQWFLLVISGFMLAYIPYFTASRKRNLRRRSARVLGDVIDHETRAGHHSVDSYSPPTKHPVVCYVVNGKTYRIVSDTGASVELLAKGQRVEVAYNPRRPSDAQLLHPRLNATDNGIILAFAMLGGGIFIYNLIVIMGW